MEVDNITRVEVILGKKAEGRPITPEEYQIMSQFVDRVERGLIHRRTAEKLAEEQRRKETRASIPEAAFGMTLEELALSERIYDLLSSSGYETIGDLMFQLALDEDAVLGISGIGPKAMDEIKEKLAGLVYPSPEPEVAPVEEVVPVTEELEEVLLPVSEELGEPVAAELVLETISPTPSVEETPVVPEEVIQGQEAVTEGEPSEVTEAVTDEDKPIDFNEIFTLRPETLVNQEGEEEEDEEDIDQKDKKKKKKKKFVEVVYDPDRDITLVKRKRKRGGDWEDDWNF
jgi:N utilization substance protein A